MSTPTESSSPNPSVAESMSEAQNLIEVDDNEEEVPVDENEGSILGAKRKFTSKAWNDFKRVKNSKGEIKAKCNWCFKHLTGEAKNRTKHLLAHIKSCPYRKSKMAALGHGKPPLSQSSLRFSSGETGKVSVENYTFDQEVARKELASMMVLHEYPLCMVDHAGFRRFVSALQPLFKMVTRNTIRYEVF